LTITLCLFGILLIIIGYIFSTVTLPWFEWNLYPKPIRIQPFIWLTPILYTAGGIIIVLCITKNTFLRILLSFLVILTVSIITKPEILPI